MTETTNLGSSHVKGVRVFDEAREVGDMERDGYRFRLAFKAIAVRHEGLIYTPMVEVLVAYYLGTYLWKMGQQPGEQGACDVHLVEAVIIPSGVAPARLSTVAADEWFEERGIGALKEERRRREESLPELAKEAKP